MRIRIPGAVQAVSLAGAWVLRRWARTLNYCYRPLAENVDPRQPGLTERYIYAMWHEYLLLPVGQYASPDVYVLISRHGDAQLLAELCRRLQIPVIRGSTRRGGVEAVRQLVRAGRGCHLALTPDGPRGPRRKVQPGLVYLAARTGLPVVPVGFGLERPWRLGSWDRFALPRPWARACCVTGVPIRVPADASRFELESYRCEVEQALTGATELAEGWATTGVWAPGSVRQEPAVPQQPEVVTASAALAD